MSFSQTSSILGQMFGPTLGAMGYDLGGQTGFVLVLWLLTVATFWCLWKLKRLAADIGADYQE
ncbi:MAG TPA: hypothetical protein VNU93_07395, partial [Verrucomicrobiae bacterium]|nr:hypothetical protein [Verrucomicrobiae bacterium]